MWEVMDILINWIAVITSECTHMANHHIAQHKHIEAVFGIILQWSWTKPYAGRGHWDENVGV
jgi:hypothetical protein